MIWLILSLWYLASSALIHPHYLAYFNELIGGPKNGYKYLTDSNLDWGQDLPSLAKLIGEIKNQDSSQEVYLSYFGTDNPSTYGIEATPLPGFPDWSAPRKVKELGAGTYCISATMLQNVYNRAKKQ